VKSSEISRILFKFNLALFRRFPLLELDERLEGYCYREFIEQDGGCDIFVCGSEA
jgi:hypothetical protein